jgi:hypothetical protein
MMAAITLPNGLAEALGHMQRAVACPEEVKARIALLRVPIEEVSGTRGLTTNWRSHATGSNATGSHAPAPAASGGAAGGGGGWHSRGRDNRDGGWRPRDHRDTRDHRDNRQHRDDAPPAPRFPARAPFVDRAAMPKFGNKARTDATTEDRMLDRIRDKMNKFSPMTYDATKAWLSQLLDSGQTDFLTGFIELVFEKAASEAPFTVLYARLITELRTAFPHLGVELRRIFDAFLSVFEAAAHEPDAGSSEYAAYVALRERRKFRRGYAAFIAESARLGALTIPDLVRTCGVILEGLHAARISEGQQQLCEEYADCLGELLKGSVELVRGGIGPTVTLIREAMDRTGAKSLSNKARFALMDLVELYA